MASASAHAPLPQRCSSPRRPRQRSNGLSTASTGAGPGGGYCWRAKALGSGKRKHYRITVRALPRASGSKLNRATTHSPQARLARTKRKVRVLPAQRREGGVTG